MTKECLCFIDIRPFDVVIGSGFVNYSECLTKMKSLHGNFNVEDVLYSTTVLHSTQKKVEKLLKLLVLCIHSLIGLRNCSTFADDESTDMCTDDYKYISYTTLTFHFIDENWKL
jgi:hypothetical protein